MRKNWKRGAALALGLILAAEQPGLGVRLPGSAFAAERQATVMATSLNVRSGPGTSNSAVGKLSYGTAVTVIGETTTDGQTWYQIRFSGSTGAETTGYALSSYIKFPVTYAADSDFESYLSAQGFPESYRPALRELHAKYPNWVFTAMDTGLDWNEVIQNESVVGRNLVDKNSKSSWKSIASGAYDWGSSSWPGFDGATWVAASEEIIRYYMDPRNFINETYVFQFLRQSYDANQHTRAGLEALIKGTFLEGNGTVSDSYAGQGADSTATPGGTTAGSTSSGSTSTGSVSTTGPGSEASSGQAAVTETTAAATGTQAATDVEVGAAPGSAGTGSTGSTGAETAASTGSSVQSTSQASVSVGAAPGSTATAGTTGTTQTSGVTTGSAPTAAGSQEVSLQAPMASISVHRADRVMATVIQVGPGAGSSSDNKTSGSTAGPGGASDTTGSGSTGTTAGTVSGRTAPFVDIIMQAGVESGVNPYVLAAMIIQEQGSGGKSESISGKTGYYNYFNFGAYASDGMTAVQRGLWYASQSGDYLRPWNSSERAIIGGASQYGANYVKAGQNTFYLKKYNVQGSNIYKHQYMTNVDGAASEGAKMGQAYSETMKQTAMEFVIPVYRNMPETLSPLPTADGSPNNKLSSISVNGFTLSPAFDRDTTEYTVTVNNTVGSVELGAAAIDSSAAVSGTGTLTLSGTTTDAWISVTAGNGTVRTYKIHVTRTADGPTVGMTAGSASQTGGPGGASAGTSTETGSTYGPGQTSDSSSSQTTQTSQTGPGGSNVTIVN